MSKQLQIIYDELSPYLTQKERDILHRVLLIKARYGKIEKLYKKSKTGTAI